VDFFPARMPPTKCADFAKHINRNRLAPLATALRNTFDVKQ